MPLSAICPEHAGLTEDLKGLHSEIDRERDERREGERTLFGKIDAATAAIGKAAERISKVEGRIGAYVIAGGVLAAILSIVAQYLMQHVAKGGP